MLIFSGYVYRSFFALKGVPLSMKVDRNLCYACLFMGTSFLFQVRLANNTYTLDKNSLFEYETHFTVMVILSIICCINIPFVWMVSNGNERIPVGRENKRKNMMYVSLLVHRYMCL